ncbi:MAG TPA: hypothetical protein ENH41_04250 [Candidatus Omnitrophica bacterium]|nr:hypothetical protein [Candidatus Omnitrophota bacterium]
MIYLYHYEVINGTKSEKVIINKELKNIKELDALREKIEEEEGCWETNFSNERIKVKDVNFTFQER